MSNLLALEISKTRVINIINKICKTNKLLITGNQKILWKIFSKYSNTKITKCSFNDEKNYFLIEYILKDNPDHLNTYKLIATKITLIDLNYLNNLQNPDELKEITKSKINKEKGEESNNV